MKPPKHYPERDTLARVRAEIRDAWPTVLDKSRTHPATLPQTPKLFGSSTKTQLGESLGILTSVLYLSPADESGRNLCPHATPACAAACLGHAAGRMAFASMRNPRLWKTALYFGARHLFRRLAALEIAAHERRAKRLGMVPAIRFDGSSDTGEALAGEWPREFPGVRFYDYTKDARRALALAMDRTRRAEYSLTFSYAGTNEDDARAILAAGGNVATVFDPDPRRHEPLPARFLGAAVLDGDISDARFLDPLGGYVIGLRFKQAKGRAAALREAIAGGFVVPTTATVAPNARPVRVYRGKVAA